MSPGTRALGPPREPHGAHRATRGERLAEGARRAAGGVLVEHLAISAGRSQATGGPSSTPVGGRPGRRAPADQGSAALGRLRSSLVR